MLLFVLLFPGYKGLLYNSLWGGGDPRAVLQSASVIRTQRLFNRTDDVNKCHSLHVKQS
jgi:hypothetical protein